MVNYQPRVVDSLLRRKLQTIGAVLIEGPKLCGKSTTATMQAKSVLFMEPGRTLQIAALNPKLLLEGDVPRLIDEWQLAPQLWDAIRREVDRREGIPGQFILTGSAVPSDKSGIMHTGTGRFGWLKMRPMTLFESKESNGSVSLGALFDGDLNIACTSSLSLENVAFAACRGGWPTALRQTGELALAHAFDYFDAIVREDISRVDGTRRNQETTRKLLRSYARVQGSQISLSEIANDVGQQASEKTIGAYLSALRQIFVVEDIPAWNPNLRSKTAIRTSDTRYFIDPSIATAALGVGPRDLLLNPETFGFIFETLCMRDLRVYAEALDGSVSHFRDKNGLECDAVLHRRDGRYGLIEIKLGSEKGIEDGVKTLTKFSKKIDTDAMRSPSFLMILTASGDFAYRRDDGILVVPIGCIKP